MRPIHYAIVYLFASRSSFYDTLEMRKLVLFSSATSITIEGICPFCDPTVRKWLTHPARAQSIPFIIAPNLNGACHTPLDETVTMSWNVALAEHVGMNLGGSARIQGYKEDTERK